MHDSGLFAVVVIGGDRKSWMAMNPVRPEDAKALTGIRRAGAGLILTYHAKEVADWLS